MSSTLRYSLVAGALCTAVSSWPTAAQAQTPPPGVSRVLEEVQVTARRREENLQDVPIAITAFSGGQLESLGVDRLDDIQFHVPAMTINSAGAGSNNPVIAVRGQRASEASIHLEPAVSLYFADVVMTPTTGSNLAMYDLANVQILKGPQGTLFGRNTTGGAVLFTPNRPDGGGDNYLQLTLGNYGLTELEGGADLPLSEQLQLRVAAKATDRDGYQKNVSANPLTRGDRYWDEDSRALRLSLLATPTEHLQNLLVTAWDQNRTGGRQLVLAAINHQFASGRGFDLRDDLARVQARNDPTRVESDQPNQHEDVETWFVSNTTTLDLERVTLKNIFGYRKVEWSAVWDTDGMAEAYVNHARIGIPSTTDAEQFSNEFQLIGSSLADRLEWIAGAYLYRMEGNRTTAANIFGAIDNLQGGDVDNRSYALFLQGSYELSDALSLTVGARYSTDERELTARSGRVPTVGAGGPFTCSVRDVEGTLLSADRCKRSVEDTWSAVNWLASLSYQVSDAAMLYGAVTTGYRSGGFNLRGGSTLSLQPFDEENVITYELGLKADWELGNWQFRSNIAAYLQDFDDIQRTNSMPDPDLAGSLATVTINAASAEIRGVELELHASPTRDLDFSLSYALVDTEYKSYIDAAGVDQSGKPLEWIPKHQVTVSLRYTLPLDPTLGTVSLQASLYHQSAMTSTLNVGSANDPIRRIGSYTLENYRVQWDEVMGSNFDASFFLHNARDEIYVTGGMTTLDSQGFAAFNYGQPRTWGASLRYRF